MARPDTIEQLKDLTDKLGIEGKVIEANGMRLLHHNYNHEFVKVEGIRIIV